VTFVTVGELYYGAEKANWNAERRKKLETTLHNFVVIPYDGESCRRYGRVMADCDRRGRRVDFADAWIAACALRHDVPLVTHNSAHFNHIPDLVVVTENVGAVEP
jgi:predicted nucleic acid-binding protein